MSPTCLQPAEMAAQLLFLEAEVGILSEMLQAARVKCTAAQAAADRETDALEVRSSHLNDCAQSHARSHARMQADFLHVLRIASGT
jgi:hypothetical protein